jgi:hypothetical protein
MGGWHRMRLDDAFQIRHVLPVGPARVGFRCWAHWARFFIEKKEYAIHFLSIKSFSIGMGQQEWVDSSQ